MWPLIIMAGMSLLGQAQQNKSAGKAQLQEAKAISEANKKNFERTLFQASVLNMQKADELKILTQRKADLGAQELLAAGGSANNSAASGTVGASVDAVQTDVQAQFDRARAEVSEDAERTLTTFNMQLQETLLDGQNSLQTIRKPQTAKSWEMLLNTGMQVGSIYAQQRMQLGLGGNNGNT